MKYVCREEIYGHYEWDDDFELLANYINDTNIQNEDLFFWDGVEQLNSPFIPRGLVHGEVPSEYISYFNQFCELLENRNINVFAVGGNCNDLLEPKLPKHKRVKLFHWKTSLLHFIKHSIKSEIGEKTITKDFKKLFVFLNRHPRPERVHLLDSFYKHGLFDYGDISWNNLTSEWNGEASFKHWDEKRMILDVNNVNESPQSADFSTNFEKLEGGQFIRDYQLLNDYILDTKCLFNIACESVVKCEDDYFFITEKTWKPILLEQPSIIVGDSFYKKHMENMGFKFYDNLIDYSFYNIDWEDDDIDLYDKLSSELVKIKDKDYNELYNQINHIVYHNKKRAEEIIDNDPYISDEFIQFYKRNRNDFQKFKRLKIDMDLETVLKSKL